jgi:hypothetical protein
MDTTCPKCGRPAVITWSGVIGGPGELTERLAIRCADLHWSVVEQAPPADLPWGAVRHRSRSTGLPRSA